MNNHNLKKRRPFGHEDAPAVPGPQDPSLLTLSPTSVPHPDRFSHHDLHILHQAASILNCPITDLLALEQSSRLHQQSSPPLPYNPSHKRLRLSTDLSAMPSHERSSPSRLSGQCTPGQLNRTGAPENDYSLGVEGSRLAQYFANFCSPCTTCEPPAYMSVPVTSSLGYSTSRPLSMSEKSPAPPAFHASVNQDQANAFPCDDPSMFSQLMASYPPLQPNRPMSIQPSTRSEDMVYPEFPVGQRYFSQPQQSSPITSHVMNTNMFGSSFESASDTARRCSSGHEGYSRTSDGTETFSQHQGLDIVLSNERPPPAKRGPFKTTEDREKTAQTRKIGSCIRCRMQRIRCEINPDDEHGTCLTCQKISNAKIWRLPCLRYKITDVRLFKPGQVKGYEWTRRWGEGIADDISQWESTEIKMVRVSEGYNKQAVGLRVRRFVPQDGDSLERTWVHQGRKKKVRIPPYAIVNLEEAKHAYDDYISDNGGIKECCTNLFSNKDRMLLGTYLLAIKTAQDPETPPKEKQLLTKALQLWMAIRVTTRSTVIIGEETLGMPHDILDETSPLQGCIPLPPVMGAQIELVLTQQIQTSLRREMLENLQAMTQANKHQTWFTTYLVTFILLHNVSLLCQHDAGYARKHGIKNRFAREHMVREYQLGANILLAYFHYCNKGIYPFSAECKDQDLSTLAELDKSKLKFVQLTRERVKEYRKHWAQVRQHNEYENDFYFISQLYEENWMPQPTI